MEERFTERGRQVVVLGAGFGGLAAVRALRQSPLEVTWVDRNNYHAFLPLLYQVAAAELEPNSITYPVRSILRGEPNMRFLLGQVEELDLAERVLRGNRGQLVLRYDYLVLALGSAHNFLGIAGAAEHAFPLKTIGEAVGLRNQILRCFEQASVELDRAARRRWLTFAIVGGGPTGVEFAGALAELIRGPLRRDFPLLDFREVRILVLEYAETLVPALPAKLQAYSMRRLERMGVEVHVGAKVAAVTERAVNLTDGRAVPSATVIWTAGVQGEPLAQHWGLPIKRGGRVEVTSTLQLPGHPEVYVIGDLAACETAGRPLPQIAPVALQQGTAAAQNIERQINGMAAQPFVYRDRGTMVVIGRNAAVAQLRGGHQFTGWAAWLLWAGVHLLNLIGFRNRLIVMINWAWDYFFFERGVRLMLPGADQHMVNRRQG